MITKMPYYSPQKITICPCYLAYYIGDLVLDYHIRLREIGLQKEMDLEKSRNKYLLWKRFLDENI